jgi:hypothetical protein
MANVGAKIAMKIVTISVGIPVGIATRKAIEKLWVAAGPDRPREASEEGVQWADAIAWAAITGIGVAVADLVTRKGAEEVYRTLIGTKPPVVKSTASRSVRKAEPKFPETIAPPS